MCGIAGEAILSGDRRLSPTDLFPMIEALAHRGPESAGYWHDEGEQVLLMHARLSFVDLDGGAQPMANEDGRLWVSLNGELYGHREQRRSLVGQGHRFRTSCDAEIVPHLFEEKGVSAFPELRGEFAFALWDARERALYLVRDRFGIKPLFYRMTQDSVIFGSEAKAILSHRSAARNIDCSYLLQGLMGLTLPERCAFEGLRQVRPGHYLRIDCNGPLEEPYWRFEQRADLSGISREEAAEEFRSLFDEAVRLRLDADVEIGVYLSGGLDSSTVTEAMARLAPYPVKSFTIRFSERADDESHTAVALAKQLGVENTIVEATADKLLEAFMPALWHSEQWAVNSHGVAKFLLSQEAARQVKAVVTGEGSDDILFGYQAYSHQQLIEQRRAGSVELHEVRDFLRETANSLSLVPECDYKRDQFVTKLYGSYPYQALGAMTVARGFQFFLNRELVQEASLDELLTRHAASLPADPMAEMSGVAATRYAWVKCDLPNYIFTNLGDRPEMGNSIEGRLPFLDARVADFALALPTPLLLDENNGKLVLRQAMEGRLPDTIVRPRKNLFWTPTENEEALLRSPLFAHYLSRAVTRDVRLFVPHRIAIARALLQVVPKKSRTYRSLLALLITAATLHMLHELFVKDFRQSAARFAARHSRWRAEDLLRQGPIRLDD